MKLNTPISAAGLFIAAAAFADAGPISSPDVDQPLVTHAEKSWDFQLTPYLWTAGLKGYTGQAPNVAYIDLGFEDLASNLDFAMSGTFTGTHRSGWGFLFDGQWIELSGTSPFPAPLYSSASVDITNAFGTLAPTYRIVDREDVSMSVYAGARVTYSKTDISLLGGIAPAPPVASAVVDDTWIDGVVGISLQYHLTEKWFLTGLVDVGAGDSDLNWQALAGIGYQINDCWSAHLAYRYMKVDYEDSGFVYDIATQGVALGVGYKW